MGLRKAKASSRERDAASVQKTSSVQKTLENQNGEFFHVSLKHETVIAKKLIWSSTMSRSWRKRAILRANGLGLADLNDGRPFDPIQQDRFNLRGTRIRVAA